MDKETSEDAPAIGGDLLEQNGKLFRKNINLKT